MSESSLSISRASLIALIGRTVGYGEGTSPAWDTTQTNDINRIVDKGLRQFYQPMPLPNEKTVHTWSFMKPIMTIGLSAGAKSVQLPDDFGGFVDDLYFSANDNAYVPMTIVGVGRILKERQSDSVVTTFNGQPELAAINPLPSDGGDGQRFVLEIWPQSDSDYTLYGQYYSNPFQISSSKPYPLGGQPHTETLIESCLAASELLLDDQIDGPHYREFVRRLTASVLHDRKMMAEQRLGYNGDIPRPQPTFHRTNQFASYNGRFYLG